MTSLFDKRGFTLVEMMAAMLIMMVGLLGLLQVVIVALEHDTRNVLREEALRIAEEQMNDFRLNAFAAGVPAKVTNTLRRKIRGGERDFSVLRDFQDTGGSSSRRLRVVVQWDYKGVGSQHEIFTIKSR